MRDLRNGNVVNNVTEKSARKLWHYAITKYDVISKDLSKQDPKWYGDLALVNHQKRGNYNRYDVVQRNPKGGYRYYFGVTDDGIHGAWRRVVGLKEEKE